MGMRDEYPGWGAMPDDEPGAYDRVLETVSEHEYRERCGWLSAGEETEELATQTDSEDRQLAALFAEAEEIVKYMDPVNGTALRVAVINGGINGRKGLIDMIVKQCESIGIDIAKSAVAERLGKVRKGNEIDSHMAEEARALRRLDQLSRVCYRHITGNDYRDEYRKKREWVKAVNRMTDDELAVFCSTTHPGKKEKLIQARRRRYQ